MNRQAIMEAYDVDENGIIQSPGKYEYEPTWVPYFADDGFYDEEYDFGNDGEVDHIGVVHLDDDIRREWPELADPGIVAVAIHTDNNGFVSGATLDSEALAKLELKYLNYRADQESGE